ncbi:hypothetical protein SO802_012634 [Lithocarpus litseifolius]|uniref:Transposase-associated domain-containing protein n=1 Tax=Lithocarpus litseifolius TaxID=425828 RepID=A0AAW2D3A4_9ROSI
MSIDKAWMFIKDRGSQEWQNGMKAFLDMAFAEVAEANTIRCPCCKCVNVVPKTRNEVALDLCKFGTDQNYKIWIHHGEEWYDEPSNENSGSIDNESNQERSDDARAYEMINNMMRAEMEVNEDRTLSSSEQDTIFQSVVSMSGSKSRNVLGRGYMAKLPTSTKRVRNELNSEVQSMKSQLDAECAEKVAERAEMEAKFEAERAKRVAEHAEMEVQFQRLRQTMCEEFLAILANQSQVGRTELFYLFKLDLGLVVVVVVYDHSCVYICLIVGIVRYFVELMSWF